MSSKYIFHNNLKLYNNSLSTKKKTLNQINNSIPHKKINYFDFNFKNILLSKEGNIFKNCNKLFNESNKINIYNSVVKSSKSNRILLRDSSILSKNDNSLKKIFLNNSNNKKNYNNDDYIKLNSLFTLPLLEKKMNKYDSFKTINFPKINLLTDFNSNKYNSRNSSKNKLRLNLFNQSLTLSKTKKIDKYDNLKSFMKLKYYEDINEKLEKKLKDDSFLDRGIKDKIIKMGKVGVFWKNVIEYCSPLLFEEKYKNMKNIILKQDEKINNKGNNEFNKVLYTTMLRTKLIHNKNRNINHFLD